MTPAAAGTEKLTRRQIIDLAKRLVISDGPDNVLEFGLEVPEKYGYLAKYGREQTLAIVVEAQRQADRVIAFLGYEV